MERDTESIWLGARGEPGPPATFFDRELQTHRVGRFEAEDGVVLEDAQSGVPNVPDCRFIVTTFHCMYIRTTQATKRSERPPLDQQIV